MNNLQVLTAFENPFLRVFLTDIELSCGTVTQKMDVFNINEIGFEEVYIGIQKSLEWMPNTKTMNAKLYSVKNGTLYSAGLCFRKQKIVHQYQKNLN